MTVHTQAHQLPSPAVGAAEPCAGRYTDAPPQQPNLLLGSVQLLFWILFHPAAWRNYISRIDPALPTTFTLFDLTPDHWQNSTVRRLLWQVYGVLPLLAATVLFLLFLLTGFPLQRLPPSILHFTAIVLVMGLCFGAVVSVAAGIVGGIGISLAVGLAGGLWGISAVTNTMLALFLGIAGSVNGTLTDRKQAYLPFRQIGGVTVGVVLALALVLVRIGMTSLGEVAGLSSDTAYSLARSILVFTSFGLAIGWQRGRLAGLAGGVACGLFYNIVLNITNSGAPEPLRGLTSGALYGVSLIALFALPYVLATYSAGFWAGAWAGPIGSYGRHIYFAYGGRAGNPDWGAMPIGFVGVILGVTVSWWRPLILYPFCAAWNRLLYEAEKRRSPQRTPLLRWHSAFWDELQRLPLVGLDEHLLLVMKRNPDEGSAALEYLATSRQRWAARAVQIELDAQRLEECAGLMAIRRLGPTLGASDPADSELAAILRSFRQTSQDVDAALNQVSAYNQRQALSKASERLDSLLNQLNRSNDPDAVRFRLSALHWRQIVADRVQELDTASAVAQEIRSPYVIGMPLMAQQEIFVGRGEVSREIERFLNEPVSPPLLLYGQRRMGKTSLLNHLDRFLPSTVLPIFIDLQGPAAWAADHSGFLFSLAQAIVLATEQKRGLGLPPLSRETLVTDPFVRFGEWLTGVEQALASCGVERALLALDEFEALDDALNKGRFDAKAVLGMLRHIIQHRPYFKVLLAGSHTLDEFQQWASYLINVRLVHLSYLSHEESRQLVEQPIADFALHYEPAASQRVWELTRGHPFLVQLLCGEIIALKNRQSLAQRWLARPEDVEAAVEKTFDHGALYFADIYHNQVDEAGVRLLVWLARQGEGVVGSRAGFMNELDRLGDFDQTLAQLIRRELVEEVAGGYRFQVELIRRWFARRAASHLIEATGA
jgi:hypothetical protein